MKSLLYSLANYCGKRENISMAKLKVLNYEFFTIATSNGLYETVGANLILEDGRIFTLYNIPRFIAMECLRLLNGYTNDYRRSISEVLSELPELEEAVSSNIELIVIDQFDREREVYSATIKKKGDKQSIKMIPSHAILLSLISGSNIYVEEKLVEEQEKDSQKEYRIYRE